MSTSTELNKILPALAKVKTEMVAVSKDSENPFFKSKYADLSAHLDVVEPLLARHGLLLLQPVKNDGTTPYVATTIYHTESGQYVSSNMSLVLSKNDMQTAGSAVTYARRYSLAALLAMKTEDDDAETAVGRAKTQTKPAVPANTKYFTDRALESNKESVNKVVAKAVVLNGGVTDSDTLAKVLNSEQVVVPEVKQVTAAAPRKAAFTNNTQLKVSQKQSHQYE